MMPTVPRLWMWPGIMPILALPGDTVGADFFGMAGKIDRLVRPRHADMYNDRHSAGDNFNRGFGKELALVARQIERFCEVQIDTERASVVAEQEFNNATESVAIDFIVRGEGRDRNMDDAAGGRR